MCKQATFSKYQKRAIKFLSDYLGADTPFPTKEHRLTTSK